MIKHLYFQEKQDTFRSVSFNNIKTTFLMLLMAAFVSLLLVATEWVVASFSSIDRSDPTKESHFSDSFRIRFIRMIQDAKSNWFPFSYMFGNR